MHNIKQVLAMTLCSTLLFIGVDQTKIALTKEEPIDPVLLKEVETNTRMANAPIAGAKVALLVDLEDVTIQFDTNQVTPVSSPNPIEEETTEEEVEEVVEEEEEENKIELNNLKNTTKYASAPLNIRTTPDASDDSNIVDAVSINAELLVTAETTDSKWYRINYDGEEAYVSEKYVSDEEVEIAEPSHNESATYTTSWNGEQLNAYAGTVQGPSGKETYYNMPMSGVVSIMRGIGNNDEYWVRSDGCKMLGNYIMVAADLSIRPRGSLVETSLGTGIVCDTGTFIYSNPTQLDIATTW